MNKEKQLKPLKRSPLRVKIGKVYYTLKRYFKWYFTGIKFAQHYQEDLFPYLAFEHKTPLLRQLKDVEMWLQYNKIKNLSIAVKRLNGLVIKPGETFSYWKLLGKPTRRKGYVEGMVLSYGSFYPGVGGGLCQLSNLIYWMTLHTPLTVTERYRHSYDVFPDANRKLPFGSGATCAYNYLDLQFENKTHLDFQLRVFLNDQYLLGEWRTKEPLQYSYKVYEKDHWITQAYWGGYLRHNTIWRKVFQHGQEVADEYVTENHAIMMYQPLLHSKNDY